MDGTTQARLWDVESAALPGVPCYSDKLLEIDRQEGMSGALWNGR